MKLRELIESDLERYTQTYRLRGQTYSKQKIFWESFLFKAGFQAVFLYRLSHKCFQKGWTYAAWFLTRLNGMLTGAEIEFNAQIGPGFLIAHPVGIVIGRGTVIGQGATLFQGVSFVVKSWDPQEILKFPHIGDHCYFFTHAVALGDIKVGNYCVIGAQAVLTQDMPEGSLARGVPAQIFPEKGKKTIMTWLENKQPFPSGAF